MTQLRRVMGFWDLVLFYVVTGFSIRWIATAAAAGPSALAIWVIACITFMVPLIVCVVRLSRLLPDEGGLYVWARHAFGDCAGFLTGWTYWTANLPYFPTLLYFAGGSALFIGGADWRNLSTSSAYFIAFSVTGLMLGVFMNLVGLNVGKWLHNIGAIGAWVPALFLLIMGPIAVWRFGSATSFSWSSMMPEGNFKDVLFWSTIAFALAGYECASVISGEIEDAPRNIPRAILIAGVISALFYMAGTAAVLGAVPHDQVTSLQGFLQAIDVIARRCGLGALVPVIAALVALGALGGMAAWFAAAARLPFVAGVDRFLPEAFGRLHPRWGTPYVAIIVQATIALGFVLLGQAGTSVKGAYEVLVSTSVITYFIPYLFMFAAFIKLDRRPGSVLCGVMGFLTTTISIVLASIPAHDDPNKLLAVSKSIGSSLILLAIGVVIFMLAKRTGPDEAALPEPLIEDNLA